MTTWYTPAGEVASVRVRSALEPDLRDIRILIEESGLPVSGVGHGVGRFDVAEESGRIVGTIGLERYGRVGLLRSAAVVADSRGRGVGRILVEHAVRSASADGIECLYLLTTTAAVYFSRLGFVRIPRTTVPPEIRTSDEFAALCPDTATVMMKELR
jgi:N-acetylglutamate synthase-like GNAT family acetyltransferase